MRLYLFFPTVKTVGLDFVPVKSYSKTTQGSSILNWIIVFGYYRLKEYHWQKILTTKITIDLQSSKFERKDWRTLLVSFFE